MKPTNLQEAYDWAIHESTYFYKERRKDTHNITIDYNIMKEIVGQMKKGDTHIITTETTATLDGIRNAVTLAAGIGKSRQLDEATPTLDLLLDYITLRKRKHRKGFSGMPVLDRFSFAKMKQLCINCLNAQHPNVGYAHTRIILYYIDTKT